MNAVKTTQVQKRASADKRADSFPFVVTADLNYPYDDVIIGDRAADYDGIEIQGVRNLYENNDPRGTCIEIDADNPQFFSVYIHIKNGGVECVGDFGTHALAQAYANELHVKYGWSVSDFTPKKMNCLNLSVRVMLGAQSAYACIKTDKTSLDVRLSPGRSAKTSLSETVKEIREKAARMLKRADLIEAAATQL